MLSLIMVLSLAWGCGCGSASAAYTYCYDSINYADGEYILPEWSDTDDRGMYVWDNVTWLNGTIYFVWEDLIQYAEPAYPDEILEKYYELKEARETKPYVSEEYMAELAYNSQINEWP